VIELRLWVAIRSRYRPFEPKSIAGSDHGDRSP